MTFESEIEVRCALKLSLEGSAIHLMGAVVSAGSDEQAEGNYLEHLGISRKTLIYPLQSAS